MAMKKPQLVALAKELHIATTGLKKADLVSLIVGPQTVHGAAAQPLPSPDDDFDIKSPPVGQPAARPPGPVPIRFRMPTPPTVRFPAPIPPVGRAQGPSSPRVSSPRVSPLQFVPPAQYGLENWHFQLEMERVKFERERALREFEMQRAEREQE